MTTQKCFIILNGSPKGNELSVTIQYCRYIINRYPQHSFKIVPIAKKIRNIKNQTAYCQEILEDMKKADGIIWAFPVYLMLVPSQLKEFIELLFTYQNQQNTSLFEDMYATTISTSAKFYDYTAHQYIEAISKDLGLRYVTGYSAEMTDLFEEQEQDRLRLFWEHFIYYCNTKLHPIVQSQSNAVSSPIEYPKQTLSNPNPRSSTENNPTQKHKIVVITDVNCKDSNLAHMLTTFQTYLPVDPTIVNINDINMVSGCIGCLRCSFDNKCIFQDDHQRIFQEYVMNADAIVYALNMKDRYFSARFKRFTDRTFSNGHRPTFLDQKQAWIISSTQAGIGSFHETPYLAELIQAHAEIGRASLVGIVTDEVDKPETITKQLRILAQDLVWSLQHNYTKPKTFLGEGGHKIFRDLIYSYKFLFKQDYVYYKKEKLLDWPKDEFGLLGTLLKPFMLFSGFREEFLTKANQQMVKRYHKIVQNIQDA